jgi:hypothetical protein
MNAFASESWVFIHGQDRLLIGRKISFYRQATMISTTKSENERHRNGLVEFLKRPAVIRLASLHAASLPQNTQAKTKKISM